MLESAPTYGTSDTPDWRDRRWGQQLHEYYGARAPILGIGSGCWSGGLWRPATLASPRSARVTRFSDLRSGGSFTAGGFLHLLRNRLFRNRLLCPQPVFQRSSVGTAVGFP